MVFRFPLTALDVLLSLHGKHDAVADWRFSRRDLADAQAALADVTTPLATAWPALLYFSALPTPAVLFTVFMKQAVAVSVDGAVMYCILGRVSDQMGTALLDLWTDDGHGPSWSRGGEVGGVWRDRAVEALARRAHAAKIGSRCDCFIPFLLSMLRTYLLTF